MGSRRCRPDRILVVDDDPTIRELFVEVLSTCPAEVDSAACVDEAEQKLSRCGYSVVVTDFYMPGGKTGLDLLAYVRERCPGTRIGVITGSSGGAFKSRIIGCAPDFFMEKPVNVMDLLEKVGCLLESAGV